MERVDREITGVEYVRRDPVNRQTGSQTEEKHTAEWVNTKKEEEEKRGTWC